MVHIPAFERLEHRKYVWYVNEPIGATSLWVRYEDRDEMQSEFGTAEYPIYQNTRGLGTWNSTDVEYGTGAEEEPTDAFWEALAQFRTEAEEIDLEDCEWYEAEAIKSLINNLNQTEEWSDEMIQLVDHAEYQQNDVRLAEDDG